MHLRPSAPPLVLACLLACLLLILPGPGNEAWAQSPLQLSGSLEAGGRYRIAIPAGWSAGDALIVYNHGFNLDSGDLLQDPELSPDDAVLAEWLRRGYAVAAGTYAQRGWAVFSLAAHQRALLARFVEEAGQPGSILLVGGSLGGLASVKTAEVFTTDQQPVAGVYALCPAFAGARTWDAAADLKLVYDQVCADTGGGSIDRGSTEPEWVLDLAQVPADWGDQGDREVQRLAARLTQCTGALLPEWARTSGQRDRLQAIMDAAQLTDVDTFITNMAYATFALSDIVRAPDKLRGYSPFDNTQVDYAAFGADAAIDAGIERVQADPFARAELAALSDPNWRIGDARVLAVHTSRDEVVVPEQLSFARAAPAGNVAMALVEEDQPSHCGFSDSEFLAGFDALEDWVGGGDQPDAQALDQRCDALSAVLDGPCRFVDASAVADYDTRIPPRGLPVYAAVDAGVTGTWYDPATNGEGFIMQWLPGRHEVAVSWYTYAADGSGDPLWIVGLGIVHANTILVQDAWVYSGGGFGAGFDPATVEGERWGSFTFLLEDQAADGLRSGRVRYQGPPEFGIGERSLVQLSRDGCAADAEGCVPAQVPLHAYSGLWYRGQQGPGEGLFLHTSDEGRAVLAWYLFTPAGEPLWLIGTTEVDAAAGDVLRVDMVQASGAGFGDAFDPADVQRTPWGTVTLRFEDCNQGTLQWDAQLPGYADGSVPVQRLGGAPPGSACAPPPGP